MAIIVIGMGNRAGDCSLAALSAIKKADRVLIRHEQSFIADFLKEQGIFYEPLDNLTQKSRNFDTENRRVVRAVKDAAKTAAACFLAEGAVWEDRAAAALSKVKGAEVHFGTPKTAPAFAIPENTTGCFASAFDLDPETRLSLPLAVYDLADESVAADVKLLLSDAFSEETEVTMFVSGKSKKMRLYEIDRQKHYGPDVLLYIPKQPFLTKERYGYEDLLHLVRLLRRDDGCPWDKVQTHESLRQDLLEEAAELVGAIDNGDVDNMEEETGDVLLQGAFHSVLGEENGEFSPADVTTRVCKKLISRHSHVFGSDTSATAEEALSVWDKNKKIEKHQTGVTETMTTLPAALPQLLRAEKVKKRARRVGFDWHTTEGVLQKLKEETREVEDAAAEKDAAHLEEECGDLLLAAACVVSQLGVHPELALKAGVDKFIRRFAAMEELAKKEGKELSAEISDEEYDRLWNAAKAGEKTLGRE